MESVNEKKREIKTSLEIISIIQLQFIIYPSFRPY
jgi:hypothetical protein